MAAPAGADCAESAKEAPWAGATPGAVAPEIPHELLSELLQQMTKRAEAAEHAAAESKKREEAATHAAAESKKREEAATHATAEYKKKIEEMKKQAQIELEGFEDDDDDNVQRPAIHELNPGQDVIVDRVLRQDEKDIIDRALAALDHISKSGGAPFNFEKERFLKSHLLQWDLKKESGRYKNDLEFASVKESVGGGRTQTGKTALKAALAILGKLCGVTVVVVTTTTANRDSICDDLNGPRYFGLLTGEFEACRPLCTTICNKKTILDKCITENGVIVANLSARAVENVRKKIQEVRGSNVAMGFALVKDEGDTFDRSREGKIEVNMTLSFAGSQHELNQKLARLKSRIVELVQDMLVQSTFSEAQKKELIAVYEEGAVEKLDEKLDELAQNLAVKPEVVRTWIKKRHVSVSRVKIATGLEQNSRFRVKVDVKALNMLEVDHIKTRLEELDVKIMQLGFSRQGGLGVSKVDQDCIMLEEAMHQLTGKLPLFGRGWFGAPVSILSVSATVLPIFLRLLHEDKVSADVYIVQPPEEKYVSLSNRNMDHMDRFLLPNELVHRNGYWSSSVEELYKDAHPVDENHQKEGVLLLDAVNPRVKAEGNTLQRGKKVKSLYPRFHTIVLAGTGCMKLSVAGCREWIEGNELSTWVHNVRAQSQLEGSDPHGWMAPFIAPDISDSRHPIDASSSEIEDDDGSKPRQAGAVAARKKPSVSELLTAIVKNKGLGNPIVVIGYTRMLRGESFVSNTVTIEGQDRRIVPTHMLCGLAPGRSVEDLVQMAGRVTFIGRDVLNCNMGQDAKVKILISGKDWDLACAYYRFQDQLFDLLNQGKSIQELLAAPDENNLNPCPQIKYDWSSDITAFMGKRTIGAKKRNNPPPDPARFERPSLEDVQRIKDMFPGKVWTFERGNIEFDIKGVHQWKLCSPIPIEERYRMTPVERDIEEYLYHEKETFQSVAIIVRRAVMKAKPEWQSGAPDNPERTYFTRSGDDGTINRDDLLKDHAKLRYSQGVAKLESKPGYKQFEAARAIHEIAWVPQKSWWQKKGSCWAIFEVENPEEVKSRGMRCVDRLMLNPEIIKFARRFASYILRQPPLHEFHEIQCFCEERGLLRRQEDAVEDISSADGSPAPSTSEQRRRGRPSSGGGSSKSAGKRRRTEAASDMAGSREASRTLDMGLRSSAPEGGASQQDSDTLVNCPEGAGMQEECRACGKSVARGKCTCG